MRPAIRVGAAVLLATAADVAFDPVQRHVPLCPFKALTGWQCPLCGGLRGVDELVHLRFGAALHDNLVVVAAIPVLAVLWVLWLRRGQVPRLPRRAWVGLVALAVCFTVVRNLPFAAALRPPPV